MKKNVLVVLIGWIVLLTLPTLCVAQNDDVVVENIEAREQLTETTIRLENTLYDLNRTIDTVNRNLAEREAKLSERDSKLNWPMLFISMIISGFVGVELGRKKF